MAETTVTPAPAAATPSPTDDLVAKLAAEIRKTPAAAPPVPPTPQAAAPTRDEILKRLEAASKEGAAKYSEVLGETVLGPMQAGNIRAAAQINRRMAERDAETGPLYKRYRDKVEDRVRSMGGDAYIAEHGIDTVVRQVAAEDPAYIDELAGKRADAIVSAREAEAKKKADEAAAATPGRRPPSETIHSGVVAAPSAHTPTEDEEIARIDVSEEDAALASRIFRMKPADIRRQRYEIAQQEKRYGALGIRQLGGVPICSLGDMKTGNGNPYPGEED